MDSFVRVNIDCCYDHTHTKLGTRSGRTQISYSKCGLFAKSKLTKLKKIMHCLQWFPPRQNKILTKSRNINSGFHCIIIFPRILPSWLVTCIINEI
jgi:hypothetical protein